MFRGTYEGLHDPNQPDLALMWVTTGTHFFRLRRGDNARKLIVEHSTPGTGTRLAFIDLQPLAPLREVHAFIVWSPETVRLHVNTPLGPVESVPAPFEVDIWVAASGDWFEMGGPGVEVMGAVVYENGVEVLSPPARMTWSDTKTAVTALLTTKGPPASAHLVDVLVSNVALTFLVTGFETYCKKRFREIDGEGVAPDYEALVRAFSSAEERHSLDAGRTPAILQPEADLTPLPELINRVNFQNYKRAKTAWRRGYGIRFGVDLGMSSAALGRLQRLLSYRHRIVHGSPLTGFLNQRWVPPEEPEFSSHGLVRDATALMDEFVSALHNATLRLRPPGAAG